MTVSSEEVEGRVFGMVGTSESSVVDDTGVPGTVAGGEVGMDGVSRRKSTAIRVHPTVMLMKIGGCLLLGSG